MELGIWDIVEILRCHTAYRFISNNLFTDEHLHVQFIKWMVLNKNISITILSPNRNDVPRLY